MAEVQEEEAGLLSAARASFTALSTVARKAKSIEPFRGDGDETCVCGVAIGISAEGFVQEDCEDSEKRPADMLLFVWQVVIVKNAEKASKATASKLKYDFTSDCKQANCIYESQDAHADRLGPARARQLRKLLATIVSILTLPKFHLAT